MSSVKGNKGKRRCAGYAKVRRRRIRRRGIRSSVVKRRKA